MLSSYKSSRSLSHLLMSSWSCHVLCIICLTHTNIIHIGLYTPILNDLRLPLLQLRRPQYDRFCTSMRRVTQILGTGGHKQPPIWSFNPDPTLRLHYTTFTGLQWKSMMNKCRCHFQGYCGRLGQLQIMIRPKRHCCHIISGSFQQKVQIFARGIFLCTPS